VLIVVGRAGGIVVKDRDSDGIDVSIEGLIYGLCEEASNLVVGEIYRHFNDADGAEASWSGDRSGGRQRGRKITINQLAWMASCIKGRSSIKSSKIEWAIVLYQHCYHLLQDI
jgi:hypothetical protein